MPKWSTSVAPGRDPQTLIAGLAFDFTWAIVALPV
jgi:hypothetical protein